MSNAPATIELNGPKGYGNANNQIVIPAGTGLLLCYDIRMINHIGYMRLGIMNMGQNPLTSIQINTSTVADNPTIPTIATSTIGTPSNIMPYTLNTSGFSGSGIPAGEQFAILILAGAIGNIHVFLGSTAGTTVDASVNYEPYAQH